MSEKIFQYELNSAKALVSELRTEIVSATRNEVINVSFQKMEKGKPVVTERMKPIMRAVDVDYLELIQELREENELSFVTVENVQRSMIIPKMGFELSEVLLSWETKQKKHFLGEELPKEVKIIKSKYRLCAIARCHVIGIDDECEVMFPFDTAAQAREFVESAKDLQGKVLSVSGMIIPYFMQFKRKSGRVSERHKKLYVTSYNIYNDSFKDVDFVDKLNSFDDFAIFRDYGAGNALYAQEVNLLMWYNAFYVKQGDPVFNLILSGPPSIAKTSCLRLYQAVFGDRGQKVFQAEGSTIKGLLPSFTEPIRNGALIDASFFIGIDEFFRSAASNAQSQGHKDTSTQIQSFMSKLLAVITRGDESFSSGKGEVTDTMTAALMATDNLTAQTRHALASAIEGDPAILRRIIIVQLGTEEEWANIKGAKVRPATTELVPLARKFWLKKHGFDLMKFKRLAEWARCKSKDLYVDFEMLEKYTNDMERELIVKSCAGKEILADSAFMDNILRKVVFRLHLEAAVKCTAITRTLISSKKLPTTIQVKEEDFMVARTIMERPLRDMFDMFITSLDDSERGIERFG